MSVENVVVSILLFMASIGLAFMSVVFNTMLPPLFKTFEKKTDKAFAIAAFVFGDILLLCALILIVNGVIEEL